MGLLHFHHRGFDHFKRKHFRWQDTYAKSTKQIGGTHWKKVFDMIKNNYNSKELSEFKKLIEDKISIAQKDLSLLKSSYKNDGNNGTDDTSPTFKAFEEGSETMSKEANTQLAIRQEKFIRDLKSALVRIENNTYGICRVTGKLIQKERLMLVPHATLSIEAKNIQK